MTPFHDGTKPSGSGIARTLPAASRVPLTTGEERLICAVRSYRTTAHRGRSEGTAVSARRRRQAR